MDVEMILTYLADLAANNNREWYHANKERYAKANKEFEALVGELMLELRRFDDTIPMTEPKELTFKIVRDTRFSHDKSPYNPAFRAHISSRGKLPVPVGYFLFVSPGGRSFLGGGLFADMFKDATAMVRDYISSHGEEWQAIITDPDFAGHFTVGGTALKKVPQGYDPAHPQAEYLKNKSWYLEYPVSDEQLVKEDFVSFAADIFSKMQSFNGFLNKALERFEMPSR